MKHAAQVIVGPAAVAALPGVEIATDDPHTAAVTFLAAPGRAERILALHHAGPHGRCVACFGPRNQSPCSLEQLAKAAKTHRNQTRRRKVSHLNAEKTVPCE